MGDPETPAVAERSDTARTVHREFLVLFALIIAAVTLFSLTRVMATTIREQHRHAAREWYARGVSAIQTGRDASAIAAFRKAVVNAPEDFTYAVALGRRLRLTGRWDDAQSVLGRAHETAPYDGEVNLELARIAAARRDVTTSARLYRNALYGSWSPHDPPRIRAVRLELARMLLDNGQKDAAVSELTVAGADAPDVAANIVIGQVLLTAGDARRSSEAFGRALAVEPNNVAALTGAAEAAFARAAYPEAVRHFRRAAAAAPLSSDAATRASMAEWIVAHDPLGPRLRPEERLRRLGDALAMVQARLFACDPTGPPPPDLMRLRASLNLTAVRRDPGVIDDGVALIDRLERGACGTPDATHVALQLIAKLHTAEEQ